MNKTTLRGIMTLLALASITFFGPVACKTRLEPGGAYAPTTLKTNVDNTVTETASAAADPGFYTVDAAYDLAYSAIDGVFTFERNNRAYLWNLSPDIKHTLDQIRPQAVEANQRFLKARRIYLLNPTPSGLSDLQTILSQVQSFAGAATAVLPKK